METTEQKVIRFLAAFCGVDEARVTPDTLVNIDLGVDGDDGVALLEEFASTFDLDLDVIEVATRYFGEEGIPISAFAWPAFWILHLLGWEQKMFSGKAPLPVRVLIESAKSKQFAE